MKNIDELTLELISFEYLYNLDSISINYTQSWFRIHTEFYINESIIIRKSLMRPIPVARRQHISGSQRQARNICAVKIDKSEILCGAVARHERTFHI